MERVRRLAIAPERIFLYVHRSTILLIKNTANTSLNLEFSVEFCYYKYIILSALAYVMAELFPLENALPAGRAFLVVSLLEGQFLWRLVIKSSGNYLLIRT